MRVTSLHRAQRSDELNVHLVSLQLSGMDSQFAFTPTYKRGRVAVPKAVKPKASAASAPTKPVPPTAKAVQKRDAPFDLGIEGVSVAIVKYRDSCTYVFRAA